MFKKILKIATCGLSILIVVSSFARLPEKDSKDKDALLWRNYLLSALDARKTFFRSEDIQFAGEWTLVTYSMATFALTNLCMKHPELVEESAKAIASWIEICLGPDVRRFDEREWHENPLDAVVLRGDEGHIGYYGHVNLMLGCYALLVRDSRFRELHEQMSEAIARRMRRYPHRHVETYPGQNYPPDNTVSVASLSIAGKVLGESYSGLIQEWITKTKKLAQTSSGLVPFRIDTFTGKPVQFARGSNNGWNSFFLPLIDPVFAREQFFLLKKLYGKEALGFGVVKEFPSGHWFTMDCDTGPVIFGLGATASAFSIAGAERFGDDVFRTQLLRSFELLATTITQGSRRRYAVTPVLGDAILLAMKTACPWQPLWKK